jgi:excisionase family DNA binding protein
MAEGELVGVIDASQALGVSVSTVWRMIRRGSLPSVRRSGRRLVPIGALARGARRPRAADVPGMTERHPIFRLVGAGRSGGASPGARDKHALLAAFSRSRRSSR